MSLLRASFQECFSAWQGTFAGGQPANNKFDAEKLRYSTLRTPVARAVASVAMQYQPDMVVAIPNGANWLAIETAWRLGVAVLLLAKNPDTGEIAYQSGGQEQVEMAQRVVFIEDVPNRRTTTAKVLMLPGMAQRAVGEAAFLDRGMPDEKLALPISVSAVFTLPIPAILPHDSPLWGLVD